MKEVSMIGVLPPMKGLSHYCSALANAVAGYWNIEFIAFKKLYPNFLYPSGYEDKGFNIKLKKNIEVKRIITIYNPFSWLKAARCKNQVVHAQWWSPPIASILLTIFFLLKLFKKKIVLTVHNVEPHENNHLSKLVNKLAFKYVDRIILHSEQNKLILCRNYKIPKEKVKVIPLILYDIHGHATREESIRFLKLQRGSFVVLYFGIIRDYKGLDVLIKAFADIIKENPKAYLVIAGQSWVGWKQYQDLIDSLGISSYVKLYLNYIPDNEVKFFFEAADVVVLPYIKFDAQSAVGSTALAYNKPIIVTDVGGLSDLVRNKQVIVPPRDSASIYLAIKRIMGDSKFKNSLIADSKEIKQEFSAESVGKKTVEVYEELN